MRNLLATLIVGVLLSVPGWGDVVDLRPDADVQINWSVIGSGTGDCATGTAEYGCINSDIESPEDTTWVNATSPTNDGSPQEFTFEDAPVDCSSVNSITLKVRTNIIGTAEDELHVWLEVSGTQSGTTKVIDTWSGVADCTEGVGTTNCSLTDSTWDTLSCAQVDTLSAVLDTATNNQAMPDDTNMTVYEVEIVLDYNPSTPAEDDSPQQVIN